MDVKVEKKIRSASRRLLRIRNRRIQSREVEIVARRKPQIQNKKLLKVSQITPNKKERHKLRSIQGSLMTQVMGLMN